MVLATVGCTPGRPTESGHPAESAKPRPPAAACASMPENLSEAQGVGHDATLWALFFHPLTRNAEIKVVWRMTGAGDLSMRATGPDGATVTPVWGPESHGSSTWDRPGDEWGTGWVFPTAGCWTVRAARSQSGTGELAIQIR
jgi:hypothetical protein